MEKEVGNKYSIDNILNEINTRETTLLIEFHEEYFSYSVLLDAQNKILHSGVSEVFLDFLYCTQNQLTDIFNKEKLFKYTFGKVIVLINNHFSTLIPNIFFDESKIKEVLEFNFNLPKKNLDYIHSKLDKLDYYNVFINSLNLSKALNKNLGIKKILSSNGNLLDFLHKNSKNEDNFHLHIGKKRIQCIYFNKGVLTFNNSFLCESAEDILYNLLNVFKQLGLKTEQNGIQLSGAISEKSETYKLLYKYIKFIDFVSRPIKLNYSKSTKIDQSHFFLTHYASFLK